MDTAQAFLGVADRLGRQHRAFERFRRRYVRLRRALGDHDAEPGAAEAGPRPGDNFALSDQLVDGGGAEDGEIERRTGVDLALRYGNNRKVGRHLVLGLGFELASELGYHAGDAGAGDDLNV